MRPALSVAALAPVVAAVACGSDTAISQTDPRYPPIAGLAATAAEANSSQGGFGLYPYLTPEVRQKCTEEQFAAAIGDRVVTGPLLRIERVSLQGDVARAKLSLASGAGEREVEWRLRRLPNGTWAVEEVPGSESCTP